MINLEKALVKDAKELLKIQKQCFKNYSIKYGDFDSNPYHMTLHRMEFNLKYKFCDNANCQQSYRIEQIIHQTAGISLLAIVEMDGQESHGGQQVEDRAGRADCCHGHTGKAHEHPLIAEQMNHANHQDHRNTMIHM